MKPEVIKIDDVEYVRKESNAVKLNGMEYCIVRTYSAGVYAGYVESQTGQEVVIRNARRLWSWDGARELTQLARDGTTKPENCKFPAEINKVKVLQAIEIIHCTSKGQKSIQGVAIWTM